MSKIICDVCGTSYPETATQCPICGCVRPADTVTVTSDNNQTEAPSGTYTYVKGGRFSKANVKKRNSASVNTANAEDEEYQGDEAPKEKSGSDKGLVIAICVLLLAIIAVVIYIALHFFGPGQNGDDIHTPADTTTTVQTQPDVRTEPTVIEIPCVNITTSNTDIELTSADAAQLLNVSVEPADTTDEIIFSSSDEGVATVNDSGKIVAVAPGEAVITISCGTASAECRVVCNFEVESTEPITDGTGENTDVEVPGTTEYDPQSLKLDCKYHIVIGGVEMGDASLWNIDGKRTGTIYYDKDGKIPSSKIKFTSSDPSVCSVDNRGRITWVSAGQAYITAEYMGYKVKCRVICWPTAE